MTAGCSKRGGGGRSMRTDNIELNWTKWCGKCICCWYSYIFICRRQIVSITVHSQQARPVQYTCVYATL